jgi:hypothetical protein
MRVLYLLIAIAPPVLGLAAASGQQPAEPAQQLVREVVYNELHDHQLHGYWRYWIRKNAPGSTQLAEQVETADGPLTRLVVSNGQPLNDDARQKEQERLIRLINSPQEQAEHRRAYAEDEERIGRIVSLLPNAFLYDYVREENGCYLLAFHPNPNYAPPTIEARIFHAMSGELWVDAKMKRMARLEGRIDNDVNFGFGILGRLNKGGWFKLHRVQVNATDWKTERLEVHMSGRAMLFKTIARETSEERGGFAAVPAGMNLKQAMGVLQQSSDVLATSASGRVEPAALTMP